MPARRAATTTAVEIEQSTKLKTNEESPNSRVATSCLKQLLNAKPTRKLVKELLAYFYRARLQDQDARAVLHVRPQKAANVPAKRVATTKVVETEQLVRRPKPQKVLRSEVTLPPSVNKTIDSRLDRGKHFESNCTCWQRQTAADCEKETISCRSSSTVCTHSNNVVTGGRVGTPWGRRTAKSPAKLVCHS